MLLPFAPDSTILGNVYIADYGNHRIRKVTVSTGIISTVAGTGAATYSGDGGPATSATLYNPTGVALDASGTYVYFLAISLSSNHSLRRQRIYRRLE